MSICCHTILSQLLSFLSLFCLNSCIFGILSCHFRWCHVVLEDVWPQNQKLKLLWTYLHAYILQNKWVLEKLNLFLAPKMNADETILKIVYLLLFSLCNQETFCQSCVSERGFSRKLALSSMRWSIYGTLTFWHISQFFFFPRTRSHSTCSFFLF